jgi:hypothetical protein
MDVEPMGEEFVVAMCHHIEDPTFDATGWATNPRLRMRPVHRPPRVPADRHPVCEWTVTIDESAPPTPSPPDHLVRTRAAQLPLPTIAAGEDGYLDYRRPLDPDLDVRDFATPALQAIADEVCLQGHLLAMGFTSAVSARFGGDAAVEAGAKQFTGVAGVVAERLQRAFGLDVGAVFELHPAFRPRTYVSWDVRREGDVVLLELDDCPALAETEFGSWLTLLADGHDRALQAIATAVDPHWSVRSDGPRRWVVERGNAPFSELPEVTVTKFSTGVAFGFDR